MEIELCELERARARPDHPTYTFETLLDLRRHCPHLAFVIGTDQLQKLHTWHRFPEILSLSHWIVLNRKLDPSAGPTIEAPAVLAQWEASGLVRSEGNGWRIGPAGETYLGIFETPAPQLSSTRIRESLARSGEPPEGSLLPEVQAYLMRRGIYGTGKA